MAIDFLFSDRFKPIGLLVSILLLIVFGLRYADFATSVERGYRWCSQQPDDCDGQRLLLPLWDVVEVSDSGYSLYKTAGPVPVIGDPTGIEVGSTVSLEGLFRASDLSVIEVTREVHELRKQKKALSGLGLVFVLIVLYRGWRFEGLEVSPRG